MRRPYRVCDRDPAARDLCQPENRGPADPCQEVFPALAAGLDHDVAVCGPDVSGRGEAADEVENDAENAGGDEERVDPDESVEENDADPTP